MLLMDCGNTRIKWQIYSHDMLVEEGSECLKGLDVGAFLVLLLSRSFSEVLVSSVSGSSKFDQLISGLKEFKVVRVLRHQDLGGDYKFAYEDVNRLGLDRCLVIIAVRKLSQEGSLVIDGGSALTADYVSRDGVHLGGYIFPGYRMLQTALISGTSNIDVRHQNGTGLELGKDTESCVLNGVNVILSQAVRYLEELCCMKGVHKIYVTGGDADYIAQFISGEYEVCEDLVFKGMREVARSLLSDRGLV